MSILRDQFNQNFTRKNGLIVLSLTSLLALSWSCAQLYGSRQDANEVIDWVPVRGQTPDMLGFLSLPILGFLLTQAAILLRACVVGPYETRLTETPRSNAPQTPRSDDTSPSDPDEKSPLLSSSSSSHHKNRVLRGIGILYSTLWVYHIALSILDRYSPKTVRTFADDVTFSQLTEQSKAMVVLASVYIPVGVSLMVGAVWAGVDYCRSRGQVMENDAGLRNPVAGVGEVKRRSRRNTGANDFEAFSVDEKPLPDTTELNRLTAAFNSDLGQFGVFNRTGGFLTMGHDPYNKINGFLQELTNFGNCLLQLQQLQQDEAYNVDNVKLWLAAIAQFELAINKITIAKQKPEFQDFNDRIFRQLSSFELANKKLKLSEIKARLGAPGLRIDIPTDGKGRQTSGSPTDPEMVTVPLNSPMLGQSG